MRIHSFIAWSSLGAPAPVAEDDRWQSWRADGLGLRFRFRAGEGDASAPLHDRPPTLILGDDSEWDATTPGANLASGVPIWYDTSAKQLLIATSIVALPPIFSYRDARIVAVTSDLHLLRDVLGVRLQLLPSGVLELGHYGHPVEHRTLFRDVELAPGGGILSLGARSGAAYRRTWTLPEVDRLEWPDFLEAQIAAFTAQVARLDLRQTFLSLTAGLDTRTVFAALADRDRLVPSATMTGPKRSLDARIAARLCHAYGTTHHAVTFNQHFARELPRYVETASRLSGGQASLGQAPEVFMYDQLGSGYTARLSGNLGNQVGRGGTEGVSLRGAELSVLAPAFRDTPRPAEHWLLAKLGRDARESAQFIVQSEVPFTLVGNFGIGNHFAAQQSPYASRRLIDTLALRPTTRTGSPSGSKLRMRLRDLRHRFLGEPQHHSFQRSLVVRIGGFAAHCPVNWGWRPNGGVSTPGLAWGAATLAGMLVRAKGWDGGILRRPVEWTGLAALHDFRDSRRWLREELRSFTLDSLRAQSTREADLFDWSVLDPMLEDHFAGRRDHYETITFALDLTLAHQIFCR